MSVLFLFLCNLDNSLSSHPVYIYVFGIYVYTEVLMVKWLLSSEIETATWVQTWVGLFAFQIVLRTLGKVWIQLFLL